MYRISPASDAGDRDCRTPRNRGWRDRGTSGTITTMIGARSPANTAPFVALQAAFVRASAFALLPARDHHASEPVRASGMLDNEDARRDRSDRMRRLVWPLMPDVDMHPVRAIRIWSTFSKSGHRLCVRKCNKRPKPCSAIRIWLNRFKRDATGVAKTKMDGPPRRAAGLYVPTKPDCTP